MKRCSKIHRFIDPRPACPNCGRRFKDLTAPEHTDSGCFLGMLVGVVKDRGLLPVTSSDVAAFQDVDRLWERWGDPTADQLEEEIGSRGGSSSTRPTKTPSHPQRRSTR